MESLAVKPEHKWPGSWGCPRPVLSAVLAVGNFYKSSLVVEQAEVSLGCGASLPCPCLHMDCLSLCETPFFLRCSAVLPRTLVCPHPCSKEVKLQSLTPPEGGFAAAVASDFLSFLVLCATEVFAP